MGQNVKSNEWIEHLDELRVRIIYVLTVFICAAICIFAFSPHIVDFLRAPVSHLDVRLYTFAPAEKFMMHLHLTAWSATIVTLPFCLLQFGLFIWPALKKGEKKCSFLALLVVPFLFLGGAALAYLFLSPVALRFFLAFGAGDGVDALWSLRSYISLLASMMLGAGLMLQTPIFLLLAFALGITTPKKIARFRAHVIFIIFFLAALCTPPDIISQVMLGVPLYLLFELTLLIGRFCLSKEEAAKMVALQ